MGLEAFLKGIVSRQQPQASIDTTSDIVRLARYGEPYVLPLIRKQHTLVDEGSYFVANNGTTAITGQADFAFNALHPTLSIYNSDSPTNLDAKRIHLDYMYLLSGATAYSNATSNTGLYAAVILDNQDGVTGGTVLTPTNPNMDVSQRASVAVIRYGALTAPTASANARTVVGQRLMRIPVSATALSLANYDQWYFGFGGVEPSMSLPNAASATLEANVTGRVLPMPAIVIGPGQSAWIYIFMIANSAGVGGTTLPEFGWWER